MKVPRVSLVTAWLLAILASSRALATPSSEIWTPCVIDIQPTHVSHIGVDDYFGVGTPEQFATNVYGEWGAILSPKIAMEYGVDLLTSTDNPLFFNTKIGYREGVLGKNAPALQIGIFDIGTKPHETNFNVAYLVTGKTLPDGRTRLHLAGYYGNPGALRSSTGSRANTGWMAAFDYQLVPDKWVLAGDYASGMNFIGGGAVGAYYYFTKDISILFGPVWFNDEGINGKMKWTTQFDINF